MNVWQGACARLIARTDTQGHLNRRAGGASTATEDQANAEFISSARTDVPRLVAEVRRLQMALVKVRAALHDTYPTIADHSGRLKESDAPQAAQTWRDVSRRLD